MFLTEIDPRATVKGSRDPLGFQPVWTRFGREIVGNLTTVTTSLRNFTILLLGLHFAERAIRDGKASEEERANLFIKFEQLAAYSRFARQDDLERSGMLGIRRVERRFADRAHLRIAPERDLQILSNQKTYGIWGLYSVAATESGYCADQRLTAEGEVLVTEEYLPRLSKGGGKDGAAILKLVTNGGTFDPAGRDAPVASTLAAILSTSLSAVEKAFYADTLILRTRGGTDRTGGRQAELWQLVRRLNAEGPFRWSDLGPEEVVELRKQAAARGYGGLAEKLSHIEALEPVIVASRALFAFLLQRHDVREVDAVADLTKQWGNGLTHLRPQQIAALEAELVGAADQASARRIIQLAAALRDGDHASAIRLTLEQNAAVMASRGGASWASVEDGRLVVRLREASTALPAGNDLPGLWDNSYFVNSLKSVGSSVFSEVA